MLRTIAIDDEPMALQVIQQHCRTIPFLQLEATFTNPNEAIARLQEGNTDLLLLDIQMPDISGIELLKKLHPRPLTIFTTAYSEHAVQGFELDAVDYLLKPFSAERFLKACQKAKELFDLRKTASPAKKDLFIKTGTEQVRVAPDEILYVQSAGNYVSFILKDGKLLSRLTMAETEALLPAPDFIRIHRSYIVARRHINRFERNKVYCGQHSIPVGSAYTALLEKIVSIK
jgi:two-component system, LytTR family, response regulator